MRKLFLVVLMSMCSGCLSILTHTGTARRTYEATRYAWTDCVGIWWNEHAQCHDPIRSAYTELTWLIWVVDFPLEVVSDTLFFPIDVWK